MRDRLPQPGKEGRVKITQDNGQIVEGVLSYADDAIEEGSAYCKANVLPDEVCNLIGLPTTSEPADMFNVLAHAGELHVWKKTVTNQQAGYDLSDVKTNGTLASGEIGYTRVALSFGSSVLVSSDGYITIDNPNNRDFHATQSSGWPSLSGKFIKITDYGGDGSGSQSSANSDFQIGTILHIPSGGNIAHNGSGRIYLTKYQIVTGYGARTTATYPVSTNRNAYTEGTSAGTTIEYLGNLGDKARVQIVSYVGTGTYGKNNQTGITFDFKPKLVIIHGWMGTDIGGTYHSSNATVVIPYNSTKATLALGSDSSLRLQIVWNGKTVSWYDDLYPGLQANRSGEKYIVAAIG